ncbi:MAG: PocR ligand-binding domain-containing protein [Alistipes sp.]|nr:PocR ligand-binding domain-containing protein [Alistipes sp.]
MYLKDFMDMEKLQKIQDMFSDATGLAAIAVNQDGEYITEGSNFTDFCMKYTRNSKEGNRRCVKCDNECKGVYYCHAGLMDFASDIVIDGEKVGSVIGGQVLPNEPDLEKFEQIAGELGINPADYLEALSKVPVRSEKSIRAAAQLLCDTVNEMANLAYIEWKNAKEIKVIESEMDSLTGSVKSISDKTKELETIASRQNMLTLNASIEAARTGEAGVGFAVVAKQMGELSRHSADIYKNIKEASTTIASSIKKINEVI